MPRWEQRGGRGLARRGEAAAPGTGEEIPLKPVKIPRHSRGKMGRGRSSREEQLWTDHNPTFPPAKQCTWGVKELEVERKWDWERQKERCYSNTYLFVSRYLNLFYKATSYFPQDESVLPTTMTGKQSLWAFSCYFLCCILLRTRGAEERNEQLAWSWAVSQG